MPKYTKGFSGNMAGRPAGIPDKRTRLRKLLEPHAAELIAKLVELAKEGEPNAMKLCIDRLIPRIKDEPLSIGMLNGSLSEKSQAVLSLMTQGELSPSEAEPLLNAISSIARVIETDELTNRIEKLEEQCNEKYKKPNK